MSHLRIGFDFDDVLVSSADHTVALYNRQFGTQLTRDDWNDDPALVIPWNAVDYAAVVSRVADIQSADDFMDVEPLIGAPEVLQTLKAAGHTLVVVTGRPSRMLEPTKRLLEKYYPGIFDPNDLHFTDHFAHEGERTSKGDIATQLGLTHFVDDVLQHANEVASTGAVVVLFDDGYKWNQTDPEHGIVRLSSWKDIGEFFVAQADGLSRLSHGQADGQTERQ